MVCTDDSSLNPAERATVQAAVQATWVKANSLQDQAIANGVRSALHDAKEEAARDKAAALKAQEEELRTEAEKANRRLWEIAAREKEAAIAKALEDQGANERALKKELELQRERAAQELEDAYHSLKGQMGKVLEEQHTANINMAVQSTWESAARLEEKAVATARKEARAEADAEWEQKLSLERLKLSEDIRTTAAKAVQDATSEEDCAKTELIALRQEMERLRGELDRERTAAREAESKAAEKQKDAVAQAVKAVESIAKGAQERAVARALEAAGVKPVGVS